jgi:hypothetical protein
MGLPLCRTTISGFLLQAWIRSFGGYDKISPEAWE